MSVVAVSGDNVFTFIQRVEEWGVALHASNISKYSNTITCHFSIQNVCKFSPKIETNIS
jgi:hypothetical protein